MHANRPKTTEGYNTMRGTTHKVEDHLISSFKFKPILEMMLLMQLLLALGKHASENVPETRLRVVLRTTYRCVVDDFCC